MKLLRAPLAATALAALLSVSVAYPAAASSPEEAAPNITVGEVEYDADCVARVEGHVDPKYCAFQSVSSSAEDTVSIADVPAEDLALRSSEGVTLESALLAGTVTRKQWEQGKQSVIGAWRTTHKGATYYDGSYVWTEGTYAGQTGSHVCNVGGWGIGYTISTTSCTESNTWTSSPITHRYYFRVSAVVNGFPVYVDDSAIRTTSRTGAES
jgi:hypothetical protein